MPVQNYIQTNFTAGEFSPKLLARVDIDRYRNGAETLENFIVMPWGGARKRGGTKFIANTKDNGAARLVDFVFSTTQAYCLEFGDSYIRIHTADGTVTETGTSITAATQANPVVVTASGHGLPNGARVLITGVSGMTELNNREFTVANPTASTFELSGVDGTGYTAYSSGGTVARIVEVPTSYTASDLADLDFTQSADTLYIAHPSFQPATLVRNTATSWSLSNAEIINGPFRDINTNDSLTLYLSGGSATSYGTYAEGSTGITMTASSSLFTSDHVGALFRLYINDEGTGFTRLVAGTTSVAVDFVYENAGNVYVCTADTLSVAKWEGSMNLPTHTRGTVRSIQDGNTATYADLKYIHDGSVIAKVTGYTSDTVVTVSIEKNEAPAEVIGSGNATAFWEEGAFSAERGWPSKTTLYEERLWFANNAAEPQTLWASQSGAFLNFLDGADAADALTLQLSSEQVDAIQWMNGGRVLSVGTTGAEYIVTAETNDKALTPEDATIRRQTRYGSASGVSPRRVGEVVLFAQKYGDPSTSPRVIREHAYDFQNDGYLGRNITILSDHITGSGGVTSMVYQPAPWSVLWAERSDGTLAALTYERGQEVLSWHRHSLGNGTVESIATAPGSTGDNLWILANRTISGGTERHIEIMTIGLDDGGSIEDATYLDAHLTYSGGAVSSLSGLWHLRGETVRLFEDGVDQGTATVSSTGSVTLSGSATDVTVGYGYTATIKTLRAEAAIRSGTAQGKRKRISETTIRLYDSYGGTYGGDTSRTDSIVYDSVALFTGDKRLEWPDGWGYDGQAVIQHSEGYPFTVLGVVQEIRGSG